MMRSGPLLALLLCLSFQAQPEGDEKQDGPFLTPDSLWQDLTVLSSDEMAGRRTGRPGSRLAQSHIAGQFAGAGLQSFNGQYSLPFRIDSTLSDLQGTNLAGWVAGTEKVSRYLVVTAHYDHLGKKGRRIYNGADDNASGVAVLLSLARAIASQPMRHSVIFLATDAEELGLYGAKAFLDNPPVPLLNLVANLNLDMLAQGGRRQRLFIGGARHYPLLQPAVQQALQQAPLELVEGHDGMSRGYQSRSRINYRIASDHAVFAGRSIPYLFLSVADHRDYHTINDRIDRIDRDFFGRAAQTALLVLQQMDKLDYQK
ncbi:zinc-binding metallopeptidase family protein [Bowmanella dokdonensis]